METIENEQPRITISMPCWMRPERTKRAIECIKNQAVENFEAFVIGDGCPVFKPIIDDYRFISFNSEHHGIFGSWQMNYAIQNATGNYFCIMGNDDIIPKNHFENYLSEIENTDYDFVYFDTYIHGKRWKSKLKYGSIGDSAIIYRTAMLKEVCVYQSHYGTDWDNIHDLMCCGAKYKKSRNKPTYYAMGTPGNRDYEGLD